MRAISYFWRGCLWRFICEVRKNEFHITGLDGTGFIASINVALSDTKLSLKRPNDKRKFNEILSSDNI